MSDPLPEAAARRHTPCGMLILGREAKEEIATKTEVRRNVP
jgi:hypothetical protein